MQTGKEILEQYCDDNYVGITTVDCLYISKKKLIKVIDSALKEADAEGYRRACRTISNIVNKMDE